MTYTLWGRGRLLGHTDLDLPHVQAHIRLGFVEPTEEGRRLLPDATGVPAIAASLNRASRAVGEREEELQTEIADFNSACDRREALSLELRDETGAVVPAWFIRIYDLQDQSWMDDDVDLDAAEIDDKFEDDTDDEFGADDDSDVHDDELKAWLSEADLFDGPAWQPPDERWDTMRYHIQLYLYDPSRGAAEDAIIEPDT